MNPTKTSSGIKQGDITTINGNVALSLVGDYDTVSIQVSNINGAYTGALTVQIRNDPAGEWFTLGVLSALTNLKDGSQGATIPSGATGMYQLPVSAFQEVRVIALGAVGGNGARVTLVAGVGSSVLGSLPKTDGSGNVSTREQYVPLYEDNVNGVAKVEQRFSYATITTAATTTVKTGGGFIHQLRLVGGAAGAITAYDNTAASGTPIVPTVTPAGAGLLIEDVTFNTGLTIVTAAASILTVSYR